MKSNSNKLWGEFWVHSPRWIYINQSSYYYHFSIFGLSGSCCCCCYQPSPPPWVLFSLTMFHLSAPSISFWNGQPGDLFQDVEEKLPNQARLLLLILQVSASLSLSSLSGPVVCTTSRGSILWDPNLSLSCHRQSFSWPLCYRGWGLIRFVDTWKKKKMKKNNKCSMKIWWRYCGFSIGEAKMHLRIHMVKNCKQTAD